MDIEIILKEKFGFLHFRPGQEEVIRDVISGKDTIAILPTGSGKSLCYQLPAYTLIGTVLVVSPLVALMEDQVAIMKKNGEKRVVALNSFLSYDERSRILRELESYKFILISPEMLMQTTIFDKLKKITLSLIVFDEAHCISQWGFDFRPDYLRVGELFDQVDRPNMLALTATADDQVLKDIVHYLRLQNPVLHRHSLDRSNISYSIRKVDSEKEKSDWIRNRLKETTGPGIIYVASRKRADELAAYLIGNDVSVASYHAGMEQEDRAFIQEQFLSEEIEWICATNAFGMGIHKSNIRQVIHEHTPATIAAYTQEVGRAGRDGKPSAATLLYAPKDERRTRFIIQEDLPHEEEVRHFSKLIKEQVTSAEAARLAGLSETGKRVIEYYLERMPVIDAIHYMTENALEKESQLEKMVQLIHLERCVRKAVLEFFGEALESHPVFCCSACGLTDDEWVFDKKNWESKQHIVDWSERLAQLLG